jgi:Flp pilus assembly protein TadG
LPVFLLIVMATIDFGWALRAYITATNSAREGARLGVTGATEAQVKTRVVSSSANLLTADDVTVLNAEGAPGQSMVVTVDYDYQYITPLGGLLDLLGGSSLGSTLPMTTTTTMRLE